MHCVCPHQRCSLRHSVLNVAMSEYLATFGLESGRVCACSSESQRSASRRATHTGPSPGGPRGQGDTRPRPVSPFPPPRLGSPSPRPDFHTPHKRGFISGQATSWAMFPTSLLHNHSLEGFVTSGIVSISINTSKSEA